MRDDARVAPQFWTDHHGRHWKVPQIRGRLKPGKIPSHAALRAFIVARDGSCRWCGATVYLVADHIVSRRNGGTHHHNNLQALCSTCNSRKAGLVDAKGGA